jgi:hypothetical protein
MGLAGCAETFEIALRRCDRADPPAWPVSRVEVGTGDTDQPKPACAGPDPLGLVFREARAVDLDGL